MKTLIIAEAGVNHNGSIDFAFKLIDKAKEAGADAVLSKNINEPGIYVGIPAKKLDKK